MLDMLELLLTLKYISEWKSKGMSDGSIKTSLMSDKSLNPLIDYYGYKMRVKFNGSILRQPKVSYTREKALIFTSFTN